MAEIVHVGPWSILLTSLIKYKSSSIFYLERAKKTFALQRCSRLNLIHTNIEDKLCLTFRHSEVLLLSLICPPKKKKRWFPPFQEFSLFPTLVRFPRSIKEDCCSLNLRPEASLTSECFPCRLFHQESESSCLVYGLSEESESSEFVSNFSSVAYHCACWRCLQFLRIKNVKEKWIWGFQRKSFLGKMRPICGELATVVHCTYIYI